AVVPVPGLSGDRRVHQETGSRYAAWHPRHGPGTFARRPRGHRATAAITEDGAPSPRSGARRIPITASLAASRLSPPVAVEMADNLPVKLTGLLVITVCSWGASASAQPAEKIDFTRDVQPILRERCVGCHGPDMQMNGLRLDRRGDALRGGTQTDIGPGNADGSRLYHRLIGTNFGQQMPPGRPLADAEIEIIKRWIDEGAEWPDEFSGEAAALPVDADPSRLVAAIRDGQLDEVDDLLRANPQSAKLRGSFGATPLMTAALYGDASLVKRLLAAGADSNARNRAGATALMWAVPDVAKM